MSVSGLRQWRLHPRHDGVRGEAAVRQAIVNGAGFLSFGRHLFRYEDEALSGGGHLLTLTPVSRGGEDEALDGCRAEQRVPPGLLHWDAETEARLVRVLGMALFRDVARIVRIEHSRR